MTLQVLLRKASLPHCLKWCGAAALALSLPLTGSANAAEFADFLFIVDESGSMSTEHEWLGEMIDDLEASLLTKGIGTGTETNRYGLVGFGSSSSLPRRLDLDPSSTTFNPFGNAAQFRVATKDLKTTGSKEDGYRAIDFGLSDSNYTFRSDAALNIVLVTDEDRDVVDSKLTFNSILGQLNSKGVLLNAVVNYSLPNVDGKTVLGADATGRAFVADGTGGFETVPYKHVEGSGKGSGSGWTDTEKNYINLAWDTKNGNLSGATWDLNQLRAGGLAATSFTRAFVAIKTEEVQGVPEPSLLLGLGCLGLALVKTGSRREEPVAETT